MGMVQRYTLLPSTSSFSFGRNSRPARSFISAVRHDACAGLQLLVQLRQERGVQARLEKERDDSRRTDVGFEQILSEKTYLAGDARRPGVGVRLADTLGIDVDADAARAIHLRGRNR